MAKVGLVQQYRTSGNGIYRAVCIHSQAPSQDIYWVIMKKNAEWETRRGPCHGRGVEEEISGHCRKGMKP